MSKVEVNAKLLGDAFVFSKFLPVVCCDCMYTLRIWQKQINQHIIGQWTHRTTWDDKVIEGEETARWTKGRVAVTLQGYMVLEGKRSNYAVLMGWDSSAKAVVAHGVNTDGETWTIHWTDLSDDVWKGHGTGDYQGKKWKSETKFEFGEESNRYEDVTLGKPWIGVLKRKAKPEQ